jgi:hypothetical protein
MEGPYGKNILKFIFTETTTPFKRKLGMNISYMVLCKLSGFFCVDQKLKKITQWGNNTGTIGPGELKKYIYIINV